MPVPVVAVVVERDAVEFLERICQLAAWRGEPAVEWHTLHATRRHGETLVRRAQIHAVALLDITEIDRVDAPSLRRDDGRLRMPQQRPLCRAEEGVRLDVGCARPRPEPPELGFDQKLPDEGFAEAEMWLMTETRQDNDGYSLADLRCSAAFWKRYLVPQDVCKCGVSVLSLEWRRAVQHFINQNAQRPPINGACVAASFDDLWCNVLFGSDERVCSKIGDARLGVDDGLAGLMRAHTSLVAHDHGGYSTAI